MALITSHIGREQTFSPASHSMLSLQFLLSLGISAEEVHLIHRRSAAAG